jgi:hypothetical protein
MLVLISEASYEERETRASTATKASKRQITEPHHNKKQGKLPHP